MGSKREIRGSTVSRSSRRRILEIPKSRPASLLRIRLCQCLYGIFSPYQRMTSPQSKGCFRIGRGPGELEPRREGDSKVSVVSRRGVVGVKTVPGGRAVKVEGSESDGVTGGRGAGAKTGMWQGCKRQTAVDAAAMQESLGVEMLVSEDCESDYAREDVGVAGG